MIHILFGASASGSLKFVLREIGLDKKERVIPFWDMFSIGTAWKLHEENGVQSRFEWMKNCISNEYDKFPDYKQMFEKTLNQINSTPEGVHITIWASDNAHELTGLQFIVYLLKEKNIDITLINTTEEYEELFQVKKVKYTPLHTGEIPPEKLQIIYEQGHGKFFIDHDREDLEKEWLSLSNNEETLRIWRNGRIQSVPEDYYDEFIIKKAKKLHGKQKTNQFMKSARLIGEVLGHLDQYVGDAIEDVPISGELAVELSSWAMKYGEWIDWIKDKLLPNGIELEDEFNQIGIVLTKRVKQELGDKYKVKYSPSKSARFYAQNGYSL